MKTVVFKRKVNFYETDAQGIVHHSNYPRYFEEARGYWLEVNNFPYHQIRESLDIDIVLLDLNIKYKKFLTFGDNFEVITTIKPENRFYFAFEYLVKKEDTVVCEGSTRHCCISRKNKKLTSIPQQLISLINQP